MYTATDARSRYTTSNLEGVAGPRIVVMCFDRIERDLTAAIGAIERRDHYEANNALAHAQDLIGELATMLDTDAWEHAGSLLSLYDYLLRTLAVANIKKDPVMAAEALRHVRELGEAFRAAERQLAGGTSDAPAASSAATSVDAPARGRVSFQA
jgi:flagellar secretion chaperone FliS